ncbi:MAG TPA: 3-phosphoshikimate 1-carboxyvinyltransferase [Candidatus Binatia bacterium]|nr:3-phosphoshikimate 1-carboxyvinyltransferase [Candidatus Binatia bacterium]
MRRIHRLGVVGVGLIGGSLAAAVRRAGLADEIVGLGRTEENLRVARERGLLDFAGTSPEVVAGSDLVVLATPVGTLAAAAAAVAPHLRDGAVVTDAGSVKSSVVAELDSLLQPRLRFVGGHPIAGTERSGAAAADPDLFRGARCVLTPVATTDRDALARVRELWEAVGMAVVEMPPEEHDRVLALTSHLPHVLAFSLALAAGDATGDPSMLDFAGPSFRSATRVAASSPETWRDILFANRDAVLRALEAFLGKASALADALRAGDAAAVERAIARARDVRRNLEAAAPGATAAARESASPDDVVTVAPAARGLAGEIAVPGDKSIAHRALLFAGVATGRSRIRGVGQGEDNASTMRVLAALGVAIERAGDAITVDGGGFEGLRAPRDVLDCGNSGTTMRLAAGLLAARPFVSRLDGDASLRRRPMARVIEPLAAMGAAIDSDAGRPPLTVRGRSLRPASVRLAIASAQVKTAILLAGLQTEGETAVAEPAMSRDHTERLLPAFGVAVERRSALDVAVRGPVALRAAEVDVPGDPSAAAFWLVAGAIVPGSRVVVRGVGVNPTRTGAIDVLRAMGARISLAPRAPVGDEPVADVTVEASELRGTTIAGDAMLRSIDEMPVLAVAAACADGETRFRDAAELRVKESDRLAAMAAGLEALGVSVEQHPDGLTIRGRAALRGGEVESHGDHRVAMAFAIAALVARGPVTIHGARAIAVSYPEFLATLASLRGSGA